MLNVGAVWLAILVFQYGERQNFIVEFPTFQQCREEKDKIIDKLYTNENVSLVEAICLRKG